MNGSKDARILDGAVEAQDDTPELVTGDQLEGTEELLVASLPQLPVDPAELVEDNADEP